MKHLSILCFPLVFFVFGCRTTDREASTTSDKLSDEIEHVMKAELIDVWYPLAVDTLGGFLSDFSYDFKPKGEQQKMIVTQSRHVWTNSKAMQIYPENPTYRKCADHGFRFLRDVMWDKEYGGFYTLVDRNGKVINSSLHDKTAYGNSFGIYALSAYYMATKDTAALNLAKKAFLWLEKHSHDAVHKGYFQHMNRDGSVVVRTIAVPSTGETGYKDQNSSIHLLEAFTELYQVWPDPLVHERLKEMLFLIRDTIVTPKGYLALFFLPDWTPVSFRDSSQATVMKHHNLDHVSFGHDVETAYLMLEASHIAELTNDTTTSRIAKKMVDHSLDFGWDDTNGGFYDGGYYFKDSTSLTVTMKTKNWWTQAEGLNTLLMMADLYPSDKRDYYSKFEKMWGYMDKNILDHNYGGWYAGGIDLEPELKTALKGHMWKSTYHEFRSLSNCVQRLRDRSSGKAAH